jgi:hypothetical protein
MRKRGKNRAITRLLLCQHVEGEGENTNQWERDHGVIWGGSPHTVENSTGVLSDFKEHY